MRTADIRVICYECGYSGRCMDLEERLRLSSKACQEEIAAAMAETSVYHACSLCKTNFRVIGPDLDFSLTATATAYAP